MRSLRELNFVVVKDIVQKKKQHSGAEVEKSISYFFFLFFVCFCSVEAYREKKYLNLFVSAKNLFH